MYVWGPSCCLLRILTLVGLFSCSCFILYVFYVASKMFVFLQKFPEEWEKAIGGEGGASNVSIISVTVLYIISGSC